MTYMAFLLRQIQSGDIEMHDKKVMATCAACLMFDLLLTIYAIVL